MLQSVAEGVYAPIRDTDAAKRVMDRIEADPHSCGAAVGAQRLRNMNAEIRKALSRATLKRLKKLEKGFSVYDRYLKRHPQ